MLKMRNRRRRIRRVGWRRRRKRTEKVVEMEETGEEWADRGEKERGKILRGEGRSRGGIKAGVSNFPRR